MSGPKVSVYYLTPAQRAAIHERIIRQQELLEKQRREAEERRALEKARRIERERLEMFQGQLTQMSASAKAVQNQLDTYVNSAREIDQHITDADLQSQLSSAKDEINKLLTAIHEFSSLHESNALEAACEKAQKQLDVIKQRSTDLKMSIVSKEKELQGVLDDKILELSQHISANVPEEETKVDDATLATLTEIATLVEQEWLPQNLRSELAQLRQLAEKTLPDGLRSLVEIQAGPVLRRCAKYQETWDKYGAEYRELYGKYEALAQINGHSDSVEMIPFSASACIELKRRIAVEESIAQKAAEQEYIATALDEVMDEMGYAVWGHNEITKRSGKHISKALYQYKEGAAINVTRSGDGQITMELGKLDTSDRLPTAVEAKELTLEMESFCSDFAEIERRLAERGVTVGNRISMSPPSETYAQIININDYKRDENATAATKQEDRRVAKRVNKKQAQD